MIGALIPPTQFSRPCSTRHVLKPFFEGTVKPSLYHPSHWRSRKFLLDVIHHPHRNAPKAKTGLRNPQNPQNQFSNHKQPQKRLYNHPIQNRPRKCVPYVQKDNPPPFLPNAPRFCRKTPQKPIALDHNSGVHTPPTPAHTIQPPAPKKFMNAHPPTARFLRISLHPSSPFLNMC